jgi:hypothetical protein
MSRPGNLLKLLPVQEAGDSPYDKPPALTEPGGGCELKRRGMHPDWQDHSRALLATRTRRTGILQYPYGPGSVIENKQGRLRSDLAASCVTSTAIVNPSLIEPDQPTAHGCPITIDPYQSRSLGISGVSLWQLSGNKIPAFQTGSRHRKNHPFGGPNAMD